MVALTSALRKAGGDEILVRQYDRSPATAGPAATRLREYLGDDYYVRRVGGKIWARARRTGEPVMRKRKFRLGPDWVTMQQASGLLGITQYWFRTTYVDTGRLTIYRFGDRLLCKRDDVDKLVRQAKKRGSHVDDSTSTKHPNAS